MIQIHREGNTTMLQLDHGAQIYAAAAHDPDGRLYVLVAAADSQEEFIARCESQGLSTMPELIVNVVDSLELVQLMPLGTHFLDFNPDFRTID